MLLRRTFLAAMPFSTISLNALSAISHPGVKQVFAHTNPVYIRYQKRAISNAESTCHLLEFLETLENWAQLEAYWGSQAQREEALADIVEGMNFYRNICQQDTLKD